MEYEIIYSKRKTLSLCIKSGSLIVRAPLGTRKRVIEEAISRHTDWISKHTQKQMAGEERFKSLTESEINDLKLRAREYLKERTDYYTKIMRASYNRITVTSAKTRFGSCSSKGNISYSYRLMLYPSEAIDYVVVHELAHLREMNHSPAFYKIVESVLPDYKARRKLLKK